MRIALFGGTFDPVHSGHLLLAESAREAFHLDRVIFVPSGVPPHKHKPAASPSQRLKMLRLAVASNPNFEVNDWEVRQRQIVYTIDTLAHFRKTWPRHQLYFILGSDMLQSIDAWRGGRELLDRCHFLVMERPGFPLSKLPLAIRRKTRRIEMPAFPVASHEIRADVRCRRSIRYRVPESVERFIRTHRLYR